MPNLDAVIATLKVICGDTGDVVHPPLEEFFEGNRLLGAQHHSAIGPGSRPSAGQNYGERCPRKQPTTMILSEPLWPGGAGCVRINCAHDDAESLGRHD